MQCQSFIINCVAMVTTGAANIPHGSTEVNIQSYYQLLFPSIICCATLSGNDNPFIRNSVITLHPLIQASNGEQQTYQPAQKNPTGHAINISTRNQMIAHRTFILSTLDCPSKPIEILNNYIQHIILSLYTQTNCIFYHQ